MIKIILKHVLQSTAFKIVVAFFLAAVVIATVGQILKLIFVVIKQRVLRIFICIGACAISIGICFNFSKWCLLSMLFVVVLALFVSTVEKKTLAKADGVKFSLDDKFRLTSIEMWGYLCTFALFEPLLTCMNVIVCKYYEIATIEWFHFYWTFDKGIFQYAVVRYTIAFLPWLLLIMVYASLQELKEKNWLVNLDEIQQKKQMEEQAEKKRILKMNPDAGVQMQNSIAEDKYVTGDLDNNNESENDEETDAILNDISKFL